MTTRRRLWRRMALLALGLGLLFGGHVAGADTVPTLFSSFAGNVNFVGAQQTLRTQADGGDSCAVTGGTTTATLAGLPAGATIEAAYLYWAGSGATPDYDVTFEGAALPADAARRYTATFTLGSNYDYFSGVADVTATVAAKGNGNYSFAGLTIDNGNPWCASSAVLAGWALVVVYSHSSEDFRVVNVYEGFQHFRGASITLTPSNFLVPASPINGRNAHLTWEGDVGNSAPLGGFNEALTFNGNSLSDANNPIDNQFNSVSTMSNPVDTTSYGVDFDVFDISAYLSAGQSSATTVYSSGGDLVLLSAQIISTTNTPASDLSITMTRNGGLTQGQGASYTLNVTNNGPLSEPGPITVVDTLPAGLSYVSFSGTGWSCAAASQTVTCTRAGALASGASATALTLTVVVGAGASGSVTNTATVSGQNFDNDSANDTANDTATIVPGPLAYYAMDEAAWTGASGEIADSSGNGNNADRVGAPNTDAAAPVVAASPGTCRYGSIPNNTAIGTIDAVDTGVTPAAAGSVTFWYRSNTNWNGGGSADQMLLDASADLGNNNADKYFFLLKRGNGRLRFRLEDSNDTDSQAETGNMGFAANTWVHIGVTWDLANDRLEIYVNGTLEDTSTTNLNGTAGAWSSLYIGDNRTAGVSGSGYSGNSANGLIDEVRFYNSAVSQAAIQADMAATHACAGALHHLQIEHASGTALTCNESTLTIRACADATCSTQYTGGVSGTLTASGPPPTVNWVSGAGFAIVSGSSTATETVHVTTPGSTLFGTSSETPTPPNVTTCDFGSPACTFSASDSGFVFDVPNHTADTTQTVTISALQTVAPNQACVPAFQSINKTVNFWSTYLNPGTGTLAVNLNGGNIATASPGTARTLAFNASGQATLQVRYPDVGQMRINARHTGSGPDDAGLVVNGQDNFIAGPADFVVTVAGNPGAADASGAAFVRAGTNFTLSVSARNASGAVTPNYGRETVPEGVLLTRNLVAPAGGAPGTFNGATIPGSEFGAGGMVNDANGTATITNANWDEVGIITLTPAVADGDYLGAGNVSGTVSGNIGRFYPDHFDFVTVTHGCPAGSFTYSGQAFGVLVTAFNGASPAAITQNFNYGGGAGFARSVIITDADGDADPIGDFNGTNTIAASNFTSGQGSTSAIVYTFNSKETAPVTLNLRATESTDSVSSAGFTEQTTVARSGRLQIQNAFGSELLALPMPMRAQYYTANGWVTNTQDACTAIAAANLALAINLGSGTTTPALPNNPMVVGDTGLSLSAPGAGNDGYVDVTVDLSSGGLNMPWLQFDWDGVGGANDPVGRASFGLYEGSPRHIHIRERY